MIRILKEIIAFSGKRKTFTKAMIVSFIGAVFGALQFLALMMTLDIIVGGKEAHILPVFAVMLISMLGRQACFYYATNAETETGYFMAAEKRVHIGDRLRYIPMGFLMTTASEISQQLLLLHFRMWKTMRPDVWSL